MQLSPYQFCHNFNEHQLEPLYKFKSVIIVSVQFELRRLHNLNIKENGKLKIFLF